MSTLFDTRQSRNRSALPMIGSAADAALNSILSSTDSSIAKLYEDRNVMLSDGGLISFSLAGVLTFTQNLNLLLNSRVAGGSPLTISLGATTRTFANLSMLYAVIDRTAGTATLTLVSNATGLPTTTSANNEVFLIAKRFDSADGTVRIYFRDGFSLSGGQTSRLDTSSSFYASEFSAVDKTDPTKQILLQASGATTASTLTLASAVTANRVLTFPDVTDSLVARSSIDVLSNKTFSDAVTLDEIATPSNPSAGQLKFYSKNDDSLYYLNSAGIETKISSGAVPTKNVVTKTASYTATVNDDVILVDSSTATVTAQITITLPTPVGNTGKELLIQKIDSSNADYNKIAISGSIDAGSASTLYVQHDQLRIISDGTVWRTEEDRLRSKTFQLQAPLTVVAASTTNVNTATLATGTNINNVVLKNGDVVLLQNQTTNSENGFWVVCGTAGQSVRLLEYRNGTTLNNAVAVVDYFGYDFRKPQNVNTSFVRYAFIVANTVNATAGDTYTNNGFTYTVERTMAGYTALMATVVPRGVPTASGNLVKASGTGDATIAYTSFVTHAVRTLSPAVAPSNNGKYFYQNNLLKDDASPANWGTQSWSATLAATLWTVPQNVNRVLITAWAGGGGGGGGGAARTDGTSGNASGGAGGQGSIPQSISIAVTPGDVLSISLGAGGIGGRLNSTGANGGIAGNPGAAGTSTTITGTSLSLSFAPGGAGGAGTGASPAASISSTALPAAWTALGTMAAGGNGGLSASASAAVAGNPGGGNSYNNNLSTGGPAQANGGQGGGRVASASGGGGGGNGHGKGGNGGDGSFISLTPALPGADGEVNGGGGGGGGGGSAGGESASLEFPISGAGGNGGFGSAILSW